MTNTTVTNAPCTARWAVTNNDQEVHVFHIHQDDFVVESNAQGPVTFTGYQDTVAVQPGETVTILITFDQPGWFVYHCHILNHEDLGMMANICVGTTDQCSMSPPSMNMAAQTRH